MAEPIALQLPPELLAFIEQRVGERGFASVTDYLCDLVRQDELEAAKGRLRQLLIEGLESPAGASWSDARGRLQQGLAERVGAS